MKVRPHLIYVKNYNQVLQNQKKIDYTAISNKFLFGS